MWDLHINNQANGCHDGSSYLKEAMSDIAVKENDEAVSYILQDDTTNAEDFLEPCLQKQFKHYFKKLVAVGAQNWIAKICENPPQIDDSTLDKICSCLETKSYINTDKEFDIAIFYDTIGNINYIRRRYKEAQNCFEESDKIKNKLFKSCNNVHIVRSTEYLARTYLAWNKFGKALKNYKKLLKSKKSNNDSSTQLEAKINNILGEIRFRQGFNNKALRYYTIAEQLCKSQPDCKLQYIKSLIGMGKTKFALKKLPSSTMPKPLNTALENCQQAENPYLLLKSEIYDNMAVVHMWQKQYNDASNCLEMSSEIRNYVCRNDKLEMAKSYFLEGNLQKEKENFSEALSSHENSLEIRLKLKAFEDWDIAESYQEIGNVLKLQKKYQEAKESYTLSINIINSLSEDENCTISFYLHFEIGNVLDILNELNDSMKHYTRCLQIGKKIFDKPPQVIAEVHEKIGRIHSTRYNDIEAISSYEDAINVLTAINGSRSDISRLKNYILKIKVSASGQNKDDQVEKSSLQSPKAPNAASSNFYDPGNTGGQNNKNFDSNSKLQSRHLSTGSLFKSCFN